MTLLSVIIFFLVWPLSTSSM